MEEFKNNLLYVINNSKLPIDATYYVFKDVFRELDDAYKTYLRRAAAAQEAQAQANAEQAAPAPQESEKVEE
jgi:hypothetical protein